MPKSVSGATASSERRVTIDGVGAVSRAMGSKRRRAT